MYSNDVLCHIRFADARDAAVDEVTDALEDHHIAEALYVFVGLPVHPWTE